MLYWILTIAWTIVGTVFCWSFLSNKWSKKDMFDRMQLQHLKMLHPIPGDPDLGYLDLKFSIARHSVVFLVSAILIFFVKSNFVLNTVLWLHLIYSMLPLFRYNGRKRHIRETASTLSDPDALVEMLLSFTKDSFCTVVHAVLCAVLVYILFAIRP